VVAQPATVKAMTAAQARDLIMGHLQEQSRARLSALYDHAVTSA
jgi:hypothetical protein